MSSFESFKVNNKSYMFNECWSLKEIDLSNFNTIGSSNMERMFMIYSALIDLKFYFYLKKDGNVFHGFNEQSKKKIRNLDDKNKTRNIF